MIRLLSTWAVLAGVLTATATSVLAQGNAEGGGYSKIFPEEMYRRATPQQRREMEAAEARNRATWEARQQQQREQAADAAEQAPGQAQSRPPAAASQAPPPTPPAVTPQRKAKIYKWVDENGRVVFGDAPRGADAEEVKVRGTGRSAPAPAGGTSSPGAPPPLVPGQRRR